jgi:hypothetical protein
MCIIVNTWVGKGVVKEQDLAKDTVTGSKKCINCGKNMLYHAI